MFVAGRRRSRPSVHTAITCKLLPPHNTQHAAFRVCLCMSAFAPALKLGTASYAKVRHRFIACTFWLYSVAASRRETTTTACTNHARNSKSLNLLGFSGNNAPKPHIAVFIYKACAVHEHNPTLVLVLWRRIWIHAHNLLSFALALSLSLAVYLPLCPTRNTPRQQTQQHGDPHPVPLSSLIQSQFRMLQSQAASLGATQQRHRCVVCIQLLPHGIWIISTMLPVLYSASTTLYYMYIYY